MIYTLSGDWSIYPLNNQYWAMNNVWGQGSLVNGVNYTQTITIDSTTFPNNTTLSWSWPATPYTVYAYPEIIYGPLSNGYIPSGVSGPTPTQIADFTNLSASYNVALSGDLPNYDVMFDIWFTDKPGGTNLDEVMLTVHKNDCGHPAPAFSINDSTYSGNVIITGGNVGQKCIYLDPTSDKLSGTISISDIIKSLIWNGVVTGNEYVAGIEFGAEVSSSGSVQINNYGVSWNANPTTMGTTGNDTFNITSVGGNHVVGNGGTDTVVYSDSYSLFQIKTSGSELLVEENNNISNLDVLQGISLIKFSDGTYNTATSVFTPTVASIAAPVIVGDTVNSTKQVILTGTAEANCEVTVFNGTTQLGTTTANSSGAWSFTTAALATGSYAFTATATDTAGNVSLPSAVIDPVVASVIGDFIGDGKSDFLWRDTAGGGVALWEMNGSSVSLSAGIGNAPTNWVVGGLGDFNGDGKSDILWRDPTSGGVAVWEMNGSSVLLSAGIGNLPNNWVVGGVGDFNGDGKSDILWRDTTSGGIALWEMNGTSVLASASVGNLPNNWVVGGIGDFNGDGKSDILWRDTTSGGVAVWEMNGTSVLASASIGNVPTNWVVGGIGDFNGDGKSDILWRDNTSGNVAIWEMNGTSVSLSANIGNVPTNWVVAGIGDYNGDGKSDILWRDTTGGGVAVWEMNGTSILLSIGVGMVPTSWHVV